MANVIPFKGILYNTAKFSSSKGEKLLAPPYDVISPELQDILYAKSPYNVVRIDYGKELATDGNIENKYSRARAFLDQWIREEILSVCDSPSFFAHEVSYHIAGQTLKLRGFFGLVRLEALGDGNIFPHECTHSKPKRDRLELMRVCEANISPIFSLYRSDSRTSSSILERISQESPLISAADADEAVHKLWRISETEDIVAIQKELSDKAIFIADGHHRYETALDYQREMTEKHGKSKDPRPYDYVLMFLANMADEGLTILPTHRLVKGIPEDSLTLLSAHFDIEAKHNDPAILIKQMLGMRKVIGYYDSRGTCVLLRYKGSELSDVPEALRNFEVTILHELIFKKLFNIADVIYEMDASRSVQWVKKKHFDAAFFLNPTDVLDVERVALASHRMPPKSTYFYPKLLTGLVINSFNHNL